MRSIKMSLVLISVVAAVVATRGLGAVIEPNGPMMMTKVFNYQGAMPIKDDRTGDIVMNDANDTDLLEPANNNQTQQDEAACWQLILEQSAVTFALQNRVLDELKADLDELEMDQTLRERVEMITGKMRANMKEAQSALDSEAAEDYFDALFDSSENIVHLSTLIRNPKMDERVFLALVKAVSRLGRNNSALIQEFTDRCSFVQRSPRPRTASL